MKKKISEIKPDTPINLVMFGAFIAAMFSAYQVFAPQLTQIVLNKSKIEAHDALFKRFERYQSITNSHLLNISKSVSEIKGELKK